jgi:hypothetical protein
MEMHDFRFLGDEIAGCHARIKRSQPSSQSTLRFIGLEDMFS